MMLALDKEFTDDSKRRDDGSTAVFALAEYINGYTHHMLR